MTKPISQVMQAAETFTKYLEFRLHASKQARALPVVIPVVAGTVAIQCKLYTCNLHQYTLSESCKACLEGPERKSHRGGT